MPTSRLLPLRRMSLDSAKGLCSLLAITSAACSGGGGQAGSNADPEKERLEAAVAWTSVRYDIYEVLVGSFWRFCQSDAAVDDLPSQTQLLFLTAIEVYAHRRGVENLPNSHKRFLKILQGSSPLQNELQGNAVDPLNSTLFRDLIEPSLTHYLMGGTFSADGGEGRVSQPPERSLRIMARQYAEDLFLAGLIPSSHLSAAEANFELPELEGPEGGENQWYRRLTRRPAYKELEGIPAVPPSAVTPIAFLQNRLLVRSLIQATRIEENQQHRRQGRGAASTSGREGLDPGAKVETARSTLPSEAQTVETIALRDRNENRSSAESHFPCLAAMVDRLAAADPLRAAGFGDSLSFDDEYPMLSYWERRSILEVALGISPSIPVRAKATPELAARLGELLPALERDCVAGRLIPPPDPMIVEERRAEIDARAVQLRREAVCELSRAIRSLSLLYGESNLWEVKQRQASAEPSTLAVVDLEPLLSQLLAAGAKYLFRDRNAFSAHRYLLFQKELLVEFSLREDALRAFMEEAWNQLVDERETIETLYSLTFDDRLPHLNVNPLRRIGAAAQGPHSDRSPDRPDVHQGLSGTWTSLGDLDLPSSFFDEIELMSHPNFLASKKQR